MRPLDPALLRTVPQARRPLAGLAVLGVLHGALAVATPFALAALLVQAVRGRPWGEPAAYLVGVFAARAVLAFVTERAAAAAGATVSGAVRTLLLRHRLGGTEEDRGDPGAAVTAATQGADSVEPYVARYLPALVSAAVVPALSLLALAVVDWPSALVVVLTLPLLPVFAALIGARTRDATQARWRALATLSGHFLDVVRGLPTLVGYGRAGRQVTTIGDVSQQHRRATMGTLRLAFLSSAALELLATICVAMVAVLVGLRLASGGLDLQTGLVAILLAPEAYWPIRRVGAEFHSAADGAEVLSALPATVAARPATDDVPRVVASSLGYAHPGATAPVLTGVELTAGIGLTVVTGPSGVGKSTLLELLAGLRQPTSGEVVAGTAHLVTQRPFLATGSVQDNLTLGLQTHPDPPRIWRALCETGLDGVVAALPDGLASPLGDDGRGLSAGQRARLALARASLSETPVVLLDEPTAHLDDATAGLAHDVIRELARGRCVIAVTHRAELVALADTHLHLTSALAVAP